MTPSSLASRSCVTLPVAQRSARVSRARPSLRPRVPRRWRATEDENEDAAIPEVPLPEGATKPTRIPDIPAGLFGFVDYAERINSRVAMVGFVGILIVELIANRGILQLAGFDVGSGLGFEI